MRPEWPKIEAAGRNRGRRPKSRPQAELRPNGPKIKAAGRYYGKNQTDRKRSDLSACRSENEVIWQKAESLTVIRHRTDGLAAICNNEF